jgi:DNA-binding XRE family transcriptional regulator
MLATSLLERIDRGRVSNARNGLYWRQDMHRVPNLTWLYHARIAELRKEKGFTQQQLAERVGVHVQQLKRYIWLLVGALAWGLTLGTAGSSGAFGWFAIIITSCTVLSSTLDVHRIANSVGRIPSMMLQRYLIISQLRPEPSTTGIRSARGDEWRKSGRGEKIRKRQASEGRGSGHRLGSKNRCAGQAGEASLQTMTATARRRMGACGRSSPANAGTMNSPPSAVRKIHSRDL